MKILALTSVRSDYDLMTPLFNRLSGSSDIDFKLLVSGAHLSSSYGYTFEHIVKDGFDILAKIETLIDSDSKVARLKSASNLLISSIDVVASYSPDLIIYAGDREDTLIGAMLGAYLTIPTIHFYAGDHASDGYVDNPVRHAVSKLSTYMFVSNEEHKKRLVSIGESIARIYNIGSISLDKFVEHSPLSKTELFKELNAEYKAEDRIALVIFHPFDIEREHSVTYLTNIIDALLENNIVPFISYPNPDPGNKKIFNVIDRYASNAKVFVYGNLNREGFLSLFKNSTLIIGNSSAGLLEAASVPIPAINVGQRQRGRLHAKNVHFCEGDIESVKAAISYVTNEDFKNEIEKVVNPYGDGKSAERAFGLISELKFTDNVLKSEDPLLINGE